MILSSKLEGTTVAQSSGYTLITQPSQHFIESNIADYQKFKVFDNEVYEFKALTPILVANYNISWIHQSVIKWLHYDEVGIWVMEHCKQHYYELSISGSNPWFIKCNIAAYIKPHDFTFYKLKFSA